MFGSADDPHPPPGESPEARWYDWDEAAAIADEALAPALVIARAEWEALSRGGHEGGMSDGSLDRLLVVQDLDTLITQLVHRRAALAERVGLTALEAELAALAARGGGARGAPSRAGGDAEGPRGADRRGQRAAERHRAAHVRRPRLVDP